MCEDLLKAFNRCLLKITSFISTAKACKSLQQLHLPPTFHSLCISWVIPSMSSNNSALAEFPQVSMKRVDIDSTKMLFSKEDIELFEAASTRLRALLMLIMLPYLSRLQFARESPLLPPTGLSPIRVHLDPRYL